MISEEFPAVLPDLFLYLLKQALLPEGKVHRQREAFSQQQKEYDSQDYCVQCAFRRSGLFHNVPAVPAQSVWSAHHVPLLHD